MSDQSFIPEVIASQRDWFYGPLPIVNCGYCGNEGKVKTQCKTCGALLTFPPPIKPSKRLEKAEVESAPSFGEKLFGFFIVVLLIICLFSTKSRKLSRLQDETGSGTIVWTGVEKFELQSGQIVRVPCSQPQDLQELDARSR